MIQDRKVAHGNAAQLYKIAAVGNWRKHTTVHQHVPDDSFSALAQQLRYSGPWMISESLDVFIRSYRVYPRNSRHDFRIRAIVVFCYVSLEVLAEDVLRSLIPCRPAKEEPYYEVYDLGDISFDDSQRETREEELEMVRDMSFLPRSA